jgi:hypothetical protein
MFDMLHAERLGATSGDRPTIFDQIQHLAAELRRELLGTR